MSVTKKKYNRLTTEQKEYFYSNYAVMGRQMFIDSYNELFGTDHNAVWAKSTAVRLRATSQHFSPPGYYTIKEIAYLFKKTERTIQERILRGTIKAKKFGSKKWFIHEDEVANIAEYYKNEGKRMPWPAMSVSAAAKRLGMTHAGVANIVRRGYIDSIKCGKNTFVKRAHIEWGYNQMLKHGFTKIPWYKMKERMGNEF